MEFYETNENDLTANLNETFSCTCDGTCMDGVYTPDTKCWSDEDED